MENKSSSIKLESTKASAKTIRKDILSKKNELVLLNSRLDLIKKTSSAVYKRNEKISGFKKESLIIINLTKQLKHLRDKLDVTYENLRLNSLRNIFNSGFPNGVNTCELDKDGEIISFVAEYYRYILNLSTPNNSVENNISIILHLIEQTQNSSLDQNLKHEYKNLIDQILNNIYLIYQKLITTIKLIDQEMLSIDQIEDKYEITVDPFYLLFKYYHFLDQNSVDLQQEKYLVLSKDHCSQLLNIIKARYKVFIEDFKIIVNSLPPDIKTRIFDRCH